MRSLVWILVAGLLWISAAAVLDGVRLKHQNPASVGSTR